MSMKKRFFPLFALLFIILSCSTNTPLTEDIEDIISNNERNYNNSERTNLNDSIKLYASKRALQFINIEWESLSPIPSRTSHNGYKAGIHKGLLYSSTKEIDKYIGYDVSLRTFLTALRNPHSLIYTEDINGGRSASSYNNKYNGINCGAYMGIVCNTFVDFILGMRVPYNTYEYQYLDKIGVFEKPQNQTFENLKELDIIWEPGHANLILDIEKDDDGNNKEITWIESTSPYPTTHKYNSTDFYSRFNRNNGIIYRKRDFVFQIKPQMYDIHNLTYNNDICTFAGDYACFSEDDKIFINYKKNEYNKIDIYKNDSIFFTERLSENNNDYLYNLTPLKLRYGTYKASLSSMSDHSDYTHFEILQTDISYNKKDNISIITFRSNNSEPIYLEFCYKNGVTRGIYEFTDEEKEKGYVEIDANKLLQDQCGIDRFTEETFVKVFFEGEYGRAKRTLKTDLY